MQGPLDGSGYGYCALTVDGQTAIKTGNVAGGLTGVRIAQRRTVEGNLCRLPVVYQCAPHASSCSALNKKLGNCWRFLSFLVYLDWVDCRLHINI